jgi:predicted ester cyclase
MEVPNMSSSQNAALLEQWADLWSGNIALADEFVVDDFVTHIAPLPWGADVGEATGREALQQWISGGIRLLIPDMQFSVDVGPIADDHFLVVRWKLQGTYNGGVPGSSPDAVGRTVAFTGTDIVRIHDGKFAEYWLNADILFFMQQIGIHTVPTAA